MSTPARRVAGNLIWAHDGSVWAIWRVELASYPFLSTDGKLALHGRIREALVSLPRQSQLLSVCRQVPAAELAARVASRVPAGTQERWREAVRGDLSMLVAAGPVERRMYLTAQVQRPQTRTMVDSALSSVAAAFGVRGPAPRAIDSRAAEQRATEVGTRLSRTLRVQAAAEAEIWWLYRRAPLRGVDAPPPPADPTGGPVGIGRDEAVLWEGGHAEDPDRPRHRRYLRIDTDAGTSFQATALISEMPGTFVHPGGGEWFSTADLAPFDVDWFARVDAVPNIEAQTRARRQQRQLNAQYAEYEGEPAGPPRTLAAALEGVDDEQAALTASPGDPELQVTMGFTVSGATPREVDARTDQLSDLLEPWGYAMHRPTGGQVALYAAGLPGSSTPPVCDDYVQYLLPRDLAAGAPLAGSSV
ncbi:MAG TPA: hypothetical protein VMM13_08855, partial [Euzebya sp.]|nr:hypothetical protein [Euzebya sp.]